MIRGCLIIRMKMIVDSRCADKIFRYIFDLNFLYICVIKLNNKILIFRNVKFSIFYVQTITKITSYESVTSGSIFFTKYYVDTMFH